MLKAYKYRIYPNAAQAQLINKNIGSCRLVYNLALEVKNYAYTTQGKNLSKYDLINQLPELRKEYEWLREVDSQALQQSIINLDKAFTRFFKGHSEFPKFKNKYTTQSFRHPHGHNVRVENNRLFQPKFIKEGIKINIHRKPNGEIKNTTISRASSGKYFVSILVDNKMNLPTKKDVTEKTSVGVDIGIKDFIVTSNGLKISSPKHFTKSLRRLKYLSRQHSRKKKGGKNRKKSQLKLALIHEKITNQRKDFLHKLSNELIKNHDTICFETLRINNMVKNHKLAQAIQSSGWGLFIDFCKYKAEWSGKNVFQIPTFQPSTKICNICEARNETLTLADREWTCANCGTFHDRDENAAKNIKNYSLKHCGGLHREKPVELLAIAGTVKQEILKKNIAPLQTKDR
jgi:putative transposase